VARPVAVRHDHVDFDASGVGRDFPVNDLEAGGIEIARIAVVTDAEFQVSVLEAFGLES
jgi:hypothetical protein